MLPLLCLLFLRLLSLLPDGCGLLLLLLPPPLLLLLLSLLLL